MIHDCVEENNNESGSKKRLAVERANDQVKRTQVVFKCLKLELRLLEKNRLQYVHFESLSKQYENQMSSIIQNLNKIKDDVQREELLRVFGSTKPKVQQETEDGDRVLKNASHLQNKTQESIDRTAKNISESKELGVVTLKSQKEQSEHILYIQKDVNHLNEKLKYSDRLIRTLRARLRFDRMFQCFLCVNTLLLICVASVGVYFIAYGGKTKS